MTEAEAFETVALAATRVAFMDRRNSRDAVKALRDEITPALKELGLDTSDKAATARLDAEVEVRRLELCAMPYDAYLRTTHWQTVRQGALARAKHRCQVCSRTGRLHVHHNNYEARGFEMPQDVVVLCADCHYLFHNSGRLA